MKTYELSKKECNIIFHILRLHKINNTSWYENSRSDFNNPSFSENRRTKKEAIAAVIIRYLVT